MAKIKPLKPDFERQRQLVRQAITAGQTNYYALLVMNRYPQMKMKRKDIYNVIHQGNQRWDILVAIGEVVGVKVVVPSLAEAKRGVLSGIE